MRKKYYELIALMMLPVLLSGCWDYRDVNRRSITLSVGVDEADEDNVEFLGGIAKLVGVPGESRAQVTEVYNDVAKGKDFEDARKQFESKLSGMDFLGALRVIAFSKRFAEKGIEAYVNRANFLPGFRKSVLIVVSREPSKDLFKGHVSNDISEEFAIEDTVRHLAREGKALFKTVQDVQSDMQFKDIGYLLPYVGREGDTVKYLGMAAMKDSKLVGIVNNEENEAFLLMLSKKPVAQIAVPYSEDYSNLCAVRAVLKKRKIKTSYVDDKVNVDVDLKLNAQLQYQYRIASLSDEDVKKLEDEVSKVLKQNVVSAIERSQKEFQCDVFEIARYFKADNPEIYERIKWEQEYPNANFNVNVKARIVNKNLFDPNAKKEY